MRSGKLEGDILNGADPLTLEALLSTLGNTYAAYAVNSYRFNNTYTVGESTQTSKLSCEYIKTLLTLNPLSHVIDANAVQISTSNSAHISYDSSAKIFNFYYSASEYESIYLTNSTGLNVEYRVKIVNVFEKRFNPNVYRQR